MLAGQLPPCPHPRRPPLLHLAGLTFKRADAADELRQVHELNYLTFVREIGQHDDPGTPALVD